MGRDYTREEMLVEVRSAVVRLGEGSSRSDLRRYSDDELFRFAVAYLWLRLAEPICQLVKRRLVGDEAKRTWEGMCPVRNALAHDREEDIDYLRLWSNLPTTLALTSAQIDRLQATS